MLTYAQFDATLPCQAFFYGYGTYLHWGFEFDSLPCDHPIINTAFQHHLHHAISIKNKPLHTGFMFKIWDQLFDTMHVATSPHLLC